MTDHAFQNAMAMLIRHPEDHRRRQLNAFLSGFDLSAEESQQLKALAEDPRVTKYGRIMRGARFDSCFRMLKVIDHIISPEHLERLVTQDFEPQAAHHRARTFPIGFCEFLLANPGVRASLGGKYPDYVFDAITYERIQLLFKRQLFPQEILPRPSILRHLCFKVQKLDYDIPKALADAGIGKKSRAAFQPVKRDCIYLFIGDLRLPKFRAFEIDQKLKDFLDRLEKSESYEMPPGDFDLPPNFDELVDLGLFNEQKTVN